MKLIYWNSLISCFPYNISVKIIDAKFNGLVMQKNIENVIPRREDYEYMKEFKPYEFTHCIVYELARRNSNVENILNFLNDLFVIYENMIHKLLNTYSRMMQKEGKVYNQEIVEKEIREVIVSMLEANSLSSLIIELDDLNIMNVRVKVSHLIKLLTNELYEKYYIIYQNEFEPDLLHVGEIYWRSRYLERDKALTKHIFELAEEENLEEHYKISYGANDIFTVFESIKKNEKDFSFNSIYPNFKTSLRDFTDTKVYLNLKLPIKELEAYLQEIKKDYNSKKSIIKTKLELLEDELEIEKEELPKDKRINWADSFFIYDYYRYNELYVKKTDEKIKQEIILKLSKYHYVKYFEESQDGKKSKKSCKMLWKDFWKEYVEEDYNDYKEVHGEEMEIDFSDFTDIKAYIEESTIRTRIKKMREYICGKKPKYKSLIDS